MADSGGRLIPFRQGVARALQRRIGRRFLEALTATIAGQEKQVTCNNSGRSFWQDFWSKVLGGAGIEGWDEGKSGDFRHRTC